MKSFKLFFYMLVLGAFIGYVVPYFKVKPFVVSVEKKPSETAINYDKLTLVNCAPRGEQHGENWVGNDLVDTFHKHFAQTEQIFQNEKVNDDSGVNLYMRGYFQYSPPFLSDKHINIAYVFYPLFYSSYNEQKIHQRDKLKPADYGYLQVFFDEMQFYDRIAVASESYAQKMRQAGFKAYYIPQFTNPQRFYPEYDETLKSEVLFVGMRPQVRKAVKILLKYKDIPMSVYGQESDGLALEEYIDNNELHKYYSSAKIVLNDHREDMQQYGFINNRTFDVTASGGFLISDYMPEIEKIYGDSIPMWKTEEELVSLVRYYLDAEHEDERKEKAERARQITLENFTSDIISRKFMQIIAEAKKEKSL